MTAEILETRPLHEKSELVPLTIRRVREYNPPPRDKATKPSTTNKETSL